MEVVLSDKLVEETKTYMDIISERNEENSDLYEVEPEDFEKYPVINKVFKKIKPDLIKNNLPAFMFYYEDEETNYNQYNSIKEYLNELKDLYLEEMDNMIEVAFCGNAEDILKIIQYKLECFDYYLKGNPENYEFDPELSVECYKMTDEQFIHILRDKNDPEHNKYCVDSWIMTTEQFYNLMSKSENGWDFKELIKEIKGV